MAAFALSTAFLNVLIGIQTSEEILAAFLRQASLVQDDPQAFLIRVARELVVSLVGQLPRVQAILRRLDTP